MTMAGLYKSAGTDKSAGVDRAVGVESMTETSAPEAPSLPLYLAGGVIALCGVLAANAALTQPDPGWTGRAVLLTLLGFVFSYGSRYLGVKPLVVDLGIGAVTLLLLASIVGGQVVLEQFLPLGADNPSLRLIATLVWMGTVWAWALGNDTRVMLATVPAMAVLGLAASVDLNNPVLLCFGVFILTVIFLLIHQNFLQHRARAAVEVRALAPVRLLLAQIIQAGLCGLAVLLVGLVVIIPAQAVFAHLSLTQAIRRLAAGKPIPVPGSAALRFSDEDNLQIGTGTAWSSSAEVVMQVTPSDGQEHYWRGRTYDVYTGAGWQSSLENSRYPAAAEIPGTEGEGYTVPPRLTPGDSGGNTGPLMTATFHVLGDTNQFYAAAAPRRVFLATDAIQSSQGVRVCTDGRLDLLSDGPIRFPYQIVSNPAPDVTRPETQDRLRRSGTDYPSVVRDLYLRAGADGITQPEDTAFFKQAVAEAVQGLPPDRRDPLDEALALRDWVSRRCVYSLTPPPIPDADDHVRVFLKDEKRGYCDMFASSLAVLCRTASIPARLATGFAPGDPSGDGFNLRAEDKHAWTEVYFPGAGWVALDATAGASTDGSVPHTAGKRGGGALAWIRHLRAGLGAGWALVAPLLGGIALILGYVLKTEVYDRWRAKRRGQVRARPAALQAPRSALGHRYTRLARALARLGLARRPSETPDEHAVRIAPALSALEREFGVGLSLPLLSALTAAFTQACYGRPGPPLDAEKWDEVLGRFEAASWRVSLLRLWRRVTRPGTFIRKGRLGVAAPRQG